MNRTPFAISNVILCTILHLNSGHQYLSNQNTSLGPKSVHNTGVLCSMQMNNILKHFCFSFIVTCPDPPPSLDNGDYTLSSSNIVGAIATYTCNEGYRFNTTATNRTCQLNEMWSMENIQCEKGWIIQINSFPDQYLQLYPY